MFKRKLNICVLTLIAVWFLTLMFLLHLLQHTREKPDFIFQRTKLETDIIPPYTWKQDKNISRNRQAVRLKLDHLKHFNASLTARQKTFWNETTMKQTIQSSLNLHSNERQITYNHITFQEPDCDQKLLLYVCTDSYPCGGLADRQKGMTSAFLLALMTNRTLVIDYRYPCEIEKFLHPNLYDWTKCRPSIHKYWHRGQREIWTYMYGFGKFTFPSDLKKYDGGDLWDEHIIVLHINFRIIDIVKSNTIATAKMPWLLTIPEELIIKNTMEILLKNSKELDEGISQFFRMHVQENYLTCAHIRIGQNPTFKGPRKDLVFYKNEIDFLNVLLSIQNIQTSQPKGVFFLASDSDNMKTMARKYLSNVISLNRSIEHIDMIKIRSCSGTYTALLEQQILSRCRVLIMTGSGYSRMAALMGINLQHIFVTEGNRSSTDMIEVTLNKLIKMYGSFT